MSRRGDSVLRPAVARRELSRQGFARHEADEILAFRVFMRRACTPDLEPVRADHDYQRGAISGSRYLAAVASEELDA